MQEYIYVLFITFLIFFEYVLFSILLLRSCLKTEERHHSSRLAEMMGGVPPIKRSGYWD